MRDNFYMFYSLTRTNTPTYTRIYFLTHAIMSSHSSLLPDIFSPKKKEKEKEEERGERGEKGEREFGIISLAIHEDESKATQSRLCEILRASECPNDIVTLDHFIPYTETKDGNVEVCA